MPLNARLFKPTPTQFDLRRIAGLAQWYDASNQSTLTLNGSTVSQWRSLVGGVAVSQATAAAQPTLTTNYYRGRSALTFDGGDFLANLSLSIQRNGLSVGVVFDETTRTDYAGLVVGSPSSGDDYAAVPGNSFRMSVHEGTNRPVDLFAPVTNNIDLRAPAVSETTALGKAVALATIQPPVNGFGSAFLRYNGTAGAEESLYNAPSATTGTIIGGRFLGGAVDASYRFRGRMLEVAIWTRALTVTECRTFERYANAKWGTSAV